MKTSLRRSNLPPWCGEEADHEAEASTAGAALAALWRRAVCSSTLLVGQDNLEDLAENSKARVETSYEYMYKL